MNDYETNLIKSLNEMIDGYYKARTIEILQEAIEVTEIPSDCKTPSGFFRIGTRSRIPYKYLEGDIPIVGIDMVGRKIAYGEAKTVVDHIMKNTEAISVSLDEKNFSDIIAETYSKIYPIRTIFMPIKFFSRACKERIIKFENGNEYIVMGSDKIKLVLSNYFSDWGDKIIFLGNRSINWVRKKNPPLPPNLSPLDFKMCSKEDEYLKVGYKMLLDEAEFIIYTISNCRIIHPDNIVVYSPKIEQESENGE